MLLLSIQSSTENENFDRRRRAGTSAASDIWSLGCLFYELITGRFLFEDQEWARFFIRVTNPKQQLISKQNEEALGSQKYLIDFLKYILIRNPRHRPTIEHSINRFESTFSLLSIFSSAEFSNIPNPFNSSRTQDPSPFFTSSQSSRSILAQLRGTAQQSLELSSRLENSTWRVPKGYSFEPGFMLMLSQVGICSKSFFKKNREKLAMKGFTHIVSLAQTLQDMQIKRFRHFLIQEKRAAHPSAVLELTPAIFDFLRDCSLFEGAVLFIEEDSDRMLDYARGLFIRELLILAQSLLFQCSVYEMWSLVNTQVIFLYKK